MRRDGSLPGLGRRGASVSVSPGVASPSLRKGMIEIAAADGINFPLWFTGHNSLVIVIKDQVTANEILEMSQHLGGSAKVRKKDLTLADDRTCQMGLKSDNSTGTCKKN